MFKMIFKKIIQFFKGCIASIKNAFTVPATNQHYYAPTLKRLSQRRISITNLDPKEYYPIAQRDTQLGFETTKKILQHTDITSELTSSEIINLIEIHQHRFRQNKLDIDILLMIQDSSLFHLAASSPKNMLRILRSSYSTGKFSTLAMIRLLHKHRNSHVIQSTLKDTKQKYLENLSNLLHRAEQENNLGFVWRILSTSLTLLKVLHLEYRKNLTINLNTKSTIFNPYDILDQHQESSTKSIAEAFKNKLAEINPHKIEDLYTDKVKNIHIAYAILSKKPLKKIWDSKHQEKEDKEELAANYKMV